MAGGVVPRVAERVAVLAGCFASMFLRAVGESLRLARSVGSALSWCGGAGAKPLECGELSPLSHVAKRRRTRQTIPRRRLVVRQEQDTSMLR